MGKDPAYKGAGGYLNQTHPLSSRRTIGHQDFGRTSLSAKQRVELIDNHRLRERLTDLGITLFALDIPEVIAQRAQHDVCRH